MLKRSSQINIVTYLLLAVLLSSAVTFADSFTRDASYEICFTPPSNCAALMIREIDKARRQILVQAYHVTDTNIVDAVIRAKKRGVDVKVLLDKSQINSQHTARHAFERAGIKVLIDNKPAIAHNKVIIIDSLTVLGGSYNHTKNAAKRNAENMTIVRDREFARKYIENWRAREKESLSVGEYSECLQKDD